jgi:hypothetical protein
VIRFSGTDQLGRNHLWADCGQGNEAAIVFFENGTNNDLRPQVPAKQVILLTRHVATGVFTQAAARCKTAA